MRLALAESTGPGGDQMRAVWIIFPKCPGKYGNKAKEKARETEPEREREGKNKDPGERRVMPERLEYNEKTTPGSFSFRHF